MTQIELAEALGTLRTEVGNNDIPAIWLEFLLHVAARGDRGVTTIEIMKELQMKQPATSRMVKIMSRYLCKKTRRPKGYDLYIAIPDHILKHRQRLFLSARGKSIISKLSSSHKGVAS